MNTSYSELRQNLKKMIDQVSSNHEPAFITSHNKPKAVLLSYDDYRSLEETAYLLKSPKNAQRLLKAVADMGNKKKYKKQSLLDDEK